MSPLIENLRRLPANEHIFLIPNPQFLIPNVRHLISIARAIFSVSSVVERPSTNGSAITSPP